MPYEDWYEGEDLDDENEEVQEYDEEQAERLRHIGWDAEPGDPFYDWSTFVPPDEGSNQEQLGGLPADDTIIPF